MIASIRYGHALLKALMLGLFACALTLRILVPAGWMPVPGAFRITICSGMGPMAAPGAIAKGAQHDPGKQPVHHMPGHRDSPCPYTSLRLALSEPILPVLIFAMAPAEPAGFIAAQFPAFVPGLAAPPPLQTGPPRATI